MIVELHKDKLTEKEQTECWQRGRKYCSARDGNIARAFLPGSPREKVKSKSSLLL